MGDGEMSLYTAIATASGRDGRAVSSDNKLDVTLARPKELGGDGAGTTPEQLFAAGYSASIASALALEASIKNIDLADASATGEVGRIANGTGGFGLSVTLSVELPDDLDGESGRELVEAAHQVC